ncbi:hypothetical protein [Streptomyces sp. NPDC004658]|uniref:hypothetical protein n=1 Tax=Streptomyces sp. NPDC004658 TaxID=3154672 RepID=UPI0033A7057A
MQLGTAGPGCVIGVPVPGNGFGFRNPVPTQRHPILNPVPTQRHPILAKIGVALGSFALAGASALGLMHLGYDKDTAKAVTEAAAKTSIAVSVAAVQISEHRRRRQFYEALTASVRLSLPSSPAPATDQPGEAN